ncbi:MAG: hypothetical protein M1443_02190 [Nitrospirae bacterium]|nr:hypothetical protein [Nitrospirota bacterium]
MQADENKIISLYRRLLDISKKEQEEIASQDLEKIEYYNSLKDEMIKEIEKTEMPELHTTPETVEAIRSLLTEIVAVNEANTKAVQELRDRTFSEISSFHKIKTGLKAYQANI